MSEWYEKEIAELKTDRNHWRNKFHDLKRELEKDLSEANEKLSSAEYKISNELEPRLKSERSSYDSWVTNGGGNECFQNGINGNCGFKCSAFGEHDECREIFNDMSNKEVIEAYQEGYDVEDEIDDRDINIQKWLSDIKHGKTLIKELKKQIKKLRDNSLEYRFIRQEIVSKIKRKLKGGK